MFVEYYESGFVPLPIRPNSKAPMPEATGFNEWAHSGIPRSLVESFEEKFPIEQGFGIGILCGRASNICVVDIDSDSYDILHACPPSPVRRRGKKGEARFFQFNPDLSNRNFLRRDDQGRPIEGVDILVERKYIIIPPSIHPETKQPYVWLTPDNLMDQPSGELPILTPEQVDEIAAIFGQGGNQNAETVNLDLAGVYQSPDGQRVAHGSYNRLKALACGLIAEQIPIEQGIQKILKYDENFLDT